MRPPNTATARPPKNSLNAILRKGVALTTIATLLSGCAQMGWQPAPPAATAAIATPAAWSGMNARLNSNTAESLASWWQQLRDPLLDQLISDSLSAAPDVRIAQAKLRQSRASQGLAEANLLPSVGISGSASRSKSDVNAGGSGQARSVYAAGFDASWEPSIFGGLSDAATAAEADTAASAASLDSTRASLAAEVALNYINLRADQRRLAIARANVASQGETLQLVEWRAMAGLASELDVEQAKTNLEQSRATIPALETARAEAEHRLALLTGHGPAALQERLSTTQALPSAPDEIAVGIPADTIRQRPDVRAAEFTLQAEIARSGQQEAARYPNLSLNASWGWQAFSMATLGGSGTLVRSLAGSLAATLFDGGRIKNRIAVQNAVQEQALISYERSVLTALEDVENALSAYANGRDRVAARQRAADSARKAAELARTLYQAGSTDFQTVLETDRTRLSAEDALASADADVLTAVIQLYKALGGGWQHSDPVTQRTPSNANKQP